ncbi:MAG: Phosphate transporter substrate-binding protein PhoT family [Rubritepida sp.]|nr:Phosphate transporter substrate-binding protein PhoT family [Rubritepida sp.]
MPDNAASRNILMRSILLLAASLLLPGIASAQQSAVLRDRLYIVSSGSSHAVTEALVEAFTHRYAEVMQPRVEIVGSAAALDRFCAGVGINTPDIAISSRRIPRSVAEACNANGVSDVVEVQVGLGAVVIAMRRGEVIPNLTTRQIYAALAAEYAVEDEFRANPLNTWANLSNALPAMQIRAVIPDRSSGTRGLFNDFIMEGGCREVKAVRLIFSAAFRVQRCITLRSDGRVTEAASDSVPAALLEGPPGTIGAISYAQLLESGGNLVAVALNGTLPTAATIASGDYDVTRTIYLYAKRQHSRNQQGVGVVRGIREFTADAVTEATGGPGGLLAHHGLVPLAPADRARQREIAVRQTLMSR